MNKSFVIRSEHIAERCCEEIRECIGKEKPMQVIIKPYKEDKTSAQRGFWHLILQKFGDEVGYTLPEIKDLVKKEILGTKIVTVAGRSIETVASSEDEKRIGYSNLIDQTYRLAAEAGVQLPPPMYRNAE
jgi:hypothetical protein